MRTCKGCGRPMPPHKGKHRQRLYCETCHPPRRKIEPAAEVAEIDAHRQARAPVGIVERTRQRLGDKADEPEGMVVLELAAAIAAGGHSASGLAALADRFGKLYAAALATVDEQPAGDVVDGIEWGIG